MGFKSIFSILLLGFLLFTINLWGQSLSTVNIQQVKVSQLSDQQILQIWKQFQTTGMSESAAMQLLAQKGLPQTEIEAFRKRLALIQSGAKSSAGNQNNVKTKKDSISFARDTSKISAQQPVKKKSPIYGYDIFSNPNLKFEPNIRIATPKNYVLGPDDEVIIVLTGLNETTVTSKISPEGKLQIPYVGLVYLNGFTIEQATSVIKSRMQKVYPALASGKTQLAVNLGSVRSIRVTIIGEVVQPGTYTISSLSSLFNALYLSGGPSDKGSLRNIQVIRNNKVLQTVDFYNFLQKGFLAGNVRLEDQDVIRIPVYKKRIIIDGEVKRPGMYELKDTETLENLIEYAGGFSDVAYKAMAKVVQMGETERRVKDVPNNLFDQFVPKNADSVYFEPILNRFANRVVIEGAVYRPGTFELTPGLTLKQLIQKADGLREDAFLTNGIIKRVKGSSEKEMISFNVKNILSGSDADISLLREDSVRIFANEALKETLSVSIDGFVQNPGIFTYRKGMKVSDIIAMAGGFTNDAATHRVEISRLVKNDADTVANQLLQVFTVDVDSSLTNNTILLEPLDYVHIPRLVNYHAIGNVTIAGQVLFPGDYALQRRDETATELLQRAGGLTPEGSLDNIQIFRNGIRVNMDLTGRKTRYNTKASILMPGDSLVVPRDVPLVEVTGAVNNPQFISFNGRNFKYYINSAGGTTENARLSGAYVQYPNGINKPVKRFLFFKNYPSVERGSKIIVPEKSPEFKFKLGLGEITGITSALTALIGLIAILNK
ncbi:SLBB domain-containing protein [Rubrolithibacter danxiaensis]|uniref:SLBB domain-containing protein n=1 Tax=Rubrolithibacter danxiaensis TaxID=3390805 RepID=UPI003BF7FF23